MHLIYHEIKQRQMTFHMEVLGTMPFSLILRGCLNDAHSLQQCLIAFRKWIIIMRVEIPSELFSIAIRQEIGENYFQYIAQLPKIYDFYKENNIMPLTNIWEIFIRHFLNLWGNHILNISHTISRMDYPSFNKLLSYCWLKLENYAQLHIPFITFFEQLQIPVKCLGNFCRVHGHIPWKTLLDREIINSREINWDWSFS